MHTKVEKSDTSAQHPVYAAHGNRTAQGSEKKPKPTPQDTLEYIGSLVFQLQGMANEVGEHGLAHYLQLARREAQRSCRAARV